ncbi:Stage V sporulation protein T [compost metagenome]
MSIVKGDDKSRYVCQIIAPIISDGDAIGTVILLSTDYKKEITDVELKLVQSAAGFLSKQMEL